MVAFCWCLGEGGHGQAVNYTSDFDASSPEKEEEGNMKSSIFIDVIVEAVFILGKSNKKCVCLGISIFSEVPPLQSLINVKLSQQRFWHLYENRLIKMIPHNLHVSFKLVSLYRGLRIIMVYPNP